MHVAVFAVLACVAAALRHETSMHRIIQRYEDKLHRANVTLPADQWCVKSFLKINNNRFYFVFL